MKPFSLKEYLKNPSRKVVTRDRRAVKIHCTNYDSRQPIIAEIEGHDYSRSFTKDGRYYIDDRNSPYDLFFAPEKKVGWVNIYRGCCGPITSANVFSSKEEAEEASMHCNGFTQGLHLATVKVEWEE